jgi:general secretion pathway protein E
MQTLDALRQRLGALDASSEQYASQFVDVVLAAARELGASDVHFLPTGSSLRLDVRIDGVLQTVGEFPAGKVSDVVARLKVLADLLTYRTDVPQEGRVRGEQLAGEVRVSTFPTLHGEKAVLRLFAAEAKYQFLEHLGLPAEIESRLRQSLGETSGAILITGPAGSGKTTTIYACLRELLRHSAGGRSIATLEDPIEVAIPGIAQSQTSERAGFDLATGLRSLLRQDPEVIVVGEMRDPTTAGIALQASLTGQLVLTTFHAGSAAGAISRLGDMGIEPYIVRSGLLAVLCQRLVRRLCNCAESSNTDEAKLGLPVNHAKLPRGCADCHGTGYRGRTLLAELLTIDMGEVATGILHHWDADRLEQAAVASGMKSRWTAACLAIEQGQTSAAEVRRVLGFSRLA